MANVADRIVETLEAANVRRIYGLVGDSLNAITDELRQREGMQWLAVRHEEVAAFAAGAEAELTGAPDEEIVLGIQEVPSSQAMEMGVIMPEVASS